MWITENIFNKFLSFLFPVKCFSCNNEDTILCDRCLKDFSRAVDTPFTWIYTNYSFRDMRMKKIIHAIKYYHRKDLITPIVSGLATRKLKEHVAQFNNPIIIPIPMSTLRKYLRGYNHAELIALEFSKQLNIPMSTNVLAKSKNVKQQSKLKNRKDRFINMKNTFEIINLPAQAGKENILDRHIILVDDVTTTGATFLSAYETLQKAGFKNISAICIAH